VLIVDLGEGSGMTFHIERVVRIFGVFLIVSVLLMSMQVTSAAPTDVEDAMTLPDYLTKTFDGLGFADRQGMSSSLESTLDAVSLLVNCDTQWTYRLWYQLESIFSRYKAMQSPTRGGFTLEGNDAPDFKTTALILETLKLLDRLDDVDIEMVERYLWSSFRETLTLRNWATEGILDTKYWALRAAHAIDSIEILGLEHIDLDNILSPDINRADFPENEPYLKWNELLFSSGFYYEDGFENEPYERKVLIAKSLTMMIADDKYIRTILPLIINVDVFADEIEQRIDSDTSIMIDEDKSNPVSTREIYRLLESMDRLDILFDDEMSAHQVVTLIQGTDKQITNWYTNSTIRAQTGISALVALEDINTMVSDIANSESVTYDPVFDSSFSHKGISTWNEVRQVSVVVPPILWEESLSTSANSMNPFIPFTLFSLSVVVVLSGFGGRKRLAVILAIFTIFLFGGEYLYGIDSIVGQAAAFASSVVPNGRQDTFLNIGMSKIGTSRVELDYGTTIEEVVDIDDLTEPEDMDFVPSWTPDTDAFYLDYTPGQYGVIANPNLARINYANTFRFRWDILTEWDYAQYADIYKDYRTTELAQIMGIGQIDAQILFAADMFGADAEFVSPDYFARVHELTLAYRGVGFDDGMLRAGRETDVFVIDGRAVETDFIVDVIETTERYTCPNPNGIGPDIEVEHDVVEHTYTFSRALYDAMVNLVTDIFEARFEGSGAQYNADDIDAIVKARLQLYVRQHILRGALGAGITSLNGVRPRILVVGRGNNPNGDLIYWDSSEEAIGLDRNLMGPDDTLAIELEAGLEEYRQVGITWTEQILDGMWTMAMEGHEGQYIPQSLVSGITTIRRTYNYGFFMFQDTAALAYAAAELRLQLGAQAGSMEVGDRYRQVGWGGQTFIDLFTQVAQYLGGRETYTRVQIQTFFTQALQSLRTITTHTHMREILNAVRNDPNGRVFIITHLGTSARANQRYVAAALRADGTWLARVGDPLNQRDGPNWERTLEILHSKDSNDVGSAGVFPTLFFTGVPGVNSERTAVGYLSPEIAQIIGRKVDDLSPDQFDILLDTPWLQPELAKFGDTTESVVGIDRNRFVIAVDSALDNGALQTNPRTMMNLYGFALHRIGPPLTIGIVDNEVLLDTGNDRFGLSYTDYLLGMGAALLTQRGDALPGYVRPDLYIDNVQDYYRIRNMPGVRDDITRYAGLMRAQAQRYTQAYLQALLAQRRFPLYSPHVFLYNSRTRLGQPGLHIQTTGWSPVTADGVLTIGNALQLAYGTIAGQQPGVAGRPTYVLDMIHGIRINDFAQFVDGQVQTMDAYLDGWDGVNLHRPETETILLTTRNFPFRDLYGYATATYPHAFRGADAGRYTGIQTGGTLADGGPTLQYLIDSLVTANQMGQAGHVGQPGHPTVDLVQYRVRPGTHATRQITDGTYGFFARDQMTGAVLAIGGAAHMFGFGVNTFTTNPPVDGQILNSEYEPQDVLTLVAQLRAGQLLGGNQNNPVALENPNTAPFFDPNNPTRQALNTLPTNDPVRRNIEAYLDAADKMFILAYQLDEITRVIRNNGNDPLFRTVMLPRLEQLRTEIMAEIEVTSQDMFGEFNDLGQVSEGRLQQAARLLSDALAQGAAPQGYIDIDIEQIGAFTAGAAARLLIEATQLETGAFLMFGDTQNPPSQGNVVSDVTSSRGQDALNRAMPNGVRIALEEVGILPEGYSRHPGGLTYITRDGTILQGRVISQNLGSSPEGADVAYDTQILFTEYDPVTGKPIRSFTLNVGGKSTISENSAYAGVRRNPGELDNIYVELSIEMYDGTWNVHVDVESCDASVSATVTQLDMVEMALDALRGSEELGTERQRAMAKSEALRILRVLDTYDSPSLWNRLRNFRRWGRIKDGFSGVRETHDPVITKLASILKRWGIVDPGPLVSNIDFPSMNAYLTWWESLFVLDPTTIFNTIPIQITEFEPANINEEIQESISAWVASFMHEQSNPDIDELMRDTALHTVAMDYINTEYLCDDWAYPPYQVAEWMFVGSDIDDWYSLGHKNSMTNNAVFGNISITQELVVASDMKTDKVRLFLTDLGDIYENEKTVTIDVKANQQSTTGSVVLTKEGLVDIPLDRVIQLSAGDTLTITIPKQETSGYVWLSRVSSLLSGHSARNGGLEIGNYEMTEDVLFASAHDADKANIIGWQKTGFRYEADDGYNETLEKVFISPAVLIGDARNYLDMVFEANPRDELPRTWIVATAFDADSNTTYVEFGEYSRSNSQIYSEVPDESADTTPVFIYGEVVQPDLLITSLHLAGHSNVEVVGDTQLIQKIVEGSPGMLVMLTNAVPKELFAFNSEGVSYIQNWINSGNQIVAAGSVPFDYVYTGGDVVPAYDYLFYSEKASVGTARLVQPDSYSGVGTTTPTVPSYQGEDVTAQELILAGASSNDYVTMDFYKSNSDGSTTVVFAMSMPMEIMDPLKTERVKSYQAFDIMVDDEMVFERFAPDQLRYEEGDKAGSRVFFDDGEDSYGNRLFAQYVNRTEETGDKLEQAHYLCYLTIREPLDKGTHTIKIADRSDNDVDLTIRIYELDNIIKWERGHSNNDFRAIQAQYQGLPIYGAGLFAATGKDIIIGADELDRESITASVP
jgi:hypothetical protein